MRELIEQPPLLVDRIVHERVVGPSEIARERIVLRCGCHAGEVEDRVAAGQAVVP